MKLLQDLCLESVMLIHVFQNWNEMLSDGLHLSAEGNKFVSKGLVPILDRKLSDLSMVFPDWNDVHPTEPHKQLGIYNS